MEKRNNWFVEYEKIRDINYRKDKFWKVDFANKSVIDFGCNTGQMSRFASELGAKSVIGVDYDFDAIQRAIARHVINILALNKRGRHSLCTN